MELNASRLKQKRESPVAGQWIIVSTINLLLVSLKLKIINKTTIITFVKYIWNARFYYYTYCESIKKKNTIFRNESYLSCNSNFKWISNIVNGFNLYEKSNIRKKIRGEHFCRNNKIIMYSRFPRGVEVIYLLNSIVYDEREWLMQDISSR